MTSLPALRLADDTATIERIAELFHCVGMLLPDTADVLTLNSTQPAAEAIELLKEHQVTHIPVISHDEVLGVFSYQSFASQLLASDGQYDPITTPVEDLMDIINPQHFVSVRDNIQAATQRIDAHGFALVGFLEGLQGILTSTDIRNHLDRTAQPFVLLAEIETCIRKLIRSAVSEAQFAECLVRAQEHKKKTRGQTNKIRSVLEDMVFNDYIVIIEEPQNWQQHFQQAFGSMRLMAVTKLDQVRELRNDVFHFKRTLKEDDHAKLASHREWLLLRARKADADARGGNNNGGQ